MCEITRLLHFYNHINITAVILLSTGTTTEQAETFNPVFLSKSGFIVAQFIEDFLGSFHLAIFFITLYGNKDMF